MIKYNIFSIIYWRYLFYLLFIDILIITVLCLWYENLCGLLRYEFRYKWGQTLLPVLFLIYVCHCNEDALVQVLAESNLTAVQHTRVVIVLKYQISIRHHFTNIRQFYIINNGIKKNSIVFYTLKWR